MEKSVLQAAVFLVFLFNLTCNLGQVAPDAYWVQFTDKKGTPFLTDNPSEFLTERSIERRLKQGIQTTESDLPVNPFYVDSLKKLGLTIHLTSKWLNGAVVYSTDAALIDTLHHISFVAKPLRTSKPEVPGRSIVKFCPDEKSASEDYSNRQLSMVHGDVLHESGYMGNGMLIAVLDAGYTNSKQIESLAHLWQNNKIIASRDFVADNRDMFSAHTHGTLVLSILAGTIPDQFYGSAPEANYILVRTEKADTEFLIEEFNWVAGAEFADSLGADVINSSLGYSLFDDPAQDHSYADMNGRTTPAAFGATVAARTGMIVSCSAGNAGDEAWGKILTPADADSILTVGAVDTLGVIAKFSSRGPSADGRIKPDVCAVGAGTIGQRESNFLYSCYGTSCSSPVIAGLAACLWQTSVNSTAQQVRQAIRESSDRFDTPDSVYGYGIPDFGLATQILKSIENSTNELTTIKLFPNPVSDFAYLIVQLPWMTSDASAVIDLYNTGGILLRQSNLNLSTGLNLMQYEIPPGLEKGYYFVRISVEGRYYNMAFIKL